MSDKVKWRDAKLLRDRIEELEAQIKQDALQYLSDTGQMCDRIEELEAENADLKAKLAKIEALKSAQQQFNYCAVKIVRHGATATRLQNLENAWLVLKVQAELTSSVAADNEVKGDEDE